MDYQSVEEQIWEKTGKAKEFLREGAIGFYGAIAGSLRIPTSIRKFRNKQTVAQRRWGEYREISQKGIGVMIGMSIGAMTDVCLFEEAIHSATHKNYFPLFALAATNLTSLGFELGLLSGKKQAGNLEAQVQSASNQPKIFDLTQEATLSFEEGAPLQNDIWEKAYYKHKKEVASSETSEENKGSRENPGDIPTGFKDS